MSNTENKSLPPSNVKQFLRDYQFLIAIILLFAFLFYFADDISDKIAHSEKVAEQNIVLTEIISSQRNVIDIQSKFNTEQKAVIELQKVIIKNYSKILQDLKKFLEPPYDPDKIT